MFIEIMGAINSGQITGILGRLGDLGTIDAKYDIAVSSSTPKLDSYVSRTVEEAESLLAFVRRKNLGKINIITLDKIGGMQSRMNTPQPPPRGTKRLIDLITYKSPEVAVAFYLAVGETLVVDSLDEARRAAFDSGKRWRVVTLRGDLI